MKTPVTSQRIRDHFTYSWWKYGLLVILAFMGWSILYSMTAYRPPEEKKVVMGVYSAASSANAEAYMLDVQRIHMPDMELLEPMYILPDHQHGDMILMTRIAASDCDLYVLPGTQFQNWAVQSAFQPLDVVMPELVEELEAAEISLSRGRRVNNSTGEKHLYGIPCRELPGASHLLGMADVSDMYISVYAKTGNDENVLKFLSILVHDLMTEPPATPTDLAPAQ